MPKKLLSLTVLERLKRRLDSFSEEENQATLETRMEVASALCPCEEIIKLRKEVRELRFLGRIIQELKENME